MKSRKIYILLTQTGTVLSKTIKIYTKDSYNHVSLGLDKSLKKNLYSFSRYYARNPFLGGFTNENIKSGLYGIKKNTTACVYEITLSAEKYQKLTQAINEMHKIKKKHKFNIAGMITVVLSIPLKRKYKKFCAEFISEVLDKSGTYKNGKAHSLAKPSDFHNIKNSIKIFEGRLADYNPIEVE